MSDPANYILIENGKVTKASDRYGSYSCLVHFAKGPKCIHASINSSDRMDLRDDDVGFLVDFDNQHAIVTGSDHESANQELVDAIRQGPEVYLNFIQANWEGWRLEWGGLIRMLAYVRCFEMDALHLRLNPLTSLSYPPEYVAARSHVGPDSIADEVVRKIEANPNIFFSNRINNSEQFRFATGGLGSLLEGWPEHGSKLPELQTLKTHFGIDDIRGSLRISDSFDLAKIRRLINEVQYGGGLDVIASDFKTGKFSFRVSHQLLIVSLSIESLHTEYADFNYQFLECCYIWLARFLSEFNLARFETCPHDKIQSQIKVTGHDNNVSLMQYDFSIDAPNGNVLGFRFELKGGKLLRKFLRGCELLDNVDFPVGLFVNTGRSFNGHERQKVVMQHWMKRYPDRPIQMTLSFKKEMVAPLLRPEGFGDGEIARFRLCSSNNSGPFWSSSRHPQIFVEVVHVGAQSYLEYITQCGSEVLKQFLEQFDFEYEIWNGKFHQRWG